MTASRIPCSDGCLKPDAAATAAPLSPSTRSEASWIVDGRVVRVISDAAQSPDHPFYLDGDTADVEARRHLLTALMAAPPDHVIGVLRVCQCSFEMPYRDEAAPLQDFALGPDAGLLVHPSARRISRLPQQLATALADLAAGLAGMHQVGVAHGDSALMNAMVEPNGSALWVDLNSIRPATANAVTMDVAAFVLACLWPALLDADQFSPSLYADIGLVLKSDPDVLAALETALRQQRSDYQREGNRGAFQHAIRSATPLSRSDAFGERLRQVSAAMAPSYFLDQTTSDMNARFFAASLAAERTRARLLDEERIRLHYLRFDTEATSLKEEATRLREEASGLRVAASEAERRASAEAKELREAAAEAERTATVARQQAQDALASSEARAAAFADRADQLSGDLDLIYGSRAWHLISRLRRVKKGMTLRRRRTPAAREEQAAHDVVSPTAAVAPEATEYPYLVSVIMPVYNKGRVLSDALDSVAAQTLQGVEVVIWDDGSTDPDTLKALDEAASLPNVSLFRGANRGVSSARNSAMHFARGEFLACLDPDDAVAPTYLEKAVTVLRGRPDLSLAYPWQRSVGDKEEIWRTQDLDPARISSVNHVPVCAVFRRRVVLDTSGFSSAMDAGYEDWELWAHAAELGHKGKVIPETLFEYTYSGSVDHSRDAAAREAHLELATRIGIMHPMLEADRVAEIETRSEAIAGRLDLPNPALPAGTGRPVILMLPWFTTGGADTVVQGLAQHWVREGRTVVAITTLEMGAGMDNRVEQLMAVTPYVYQLPALLPEELWLEFVSGIAGALPEAAVVNVGSRWLHDNAAQLRASRPEMLLIDHHFNDIGHIDSHRKAIDSIDVTVTAHVALESSFAASAGAPPVTTIYAGIEPAPPSNKEETEALRRKAGFETEDQVVLFIGRLSEEKRPQWLLDLAAALDERGVKLLMVGDGPLAVELAPELERNRNIAWLPRLESVHPAYELADVLALPSRIEGIPLTAMEALAAGVPVVATAVGGLPELEDVPGVYLTDPTEQQEFIDQVLETLDAPAEKISLPDRFSAAEMLRRYSELLDSGGIGG